jgi:cytochrome b pre-mRNA-processing protein 3
MIFNIFKSRPQRKAALIIYAAISEGSRNPKIYLDFGVPDTAEGRFESLSLHLSLILRRLKELPTPALDLSKELVDHFFHDLDGALRTLGVSDVSVGKKIKPLAQAFYGRAKALDEALAQNNPQALTDVLSRNVLGDENAPTGASLATYVQAAISTLATKDISYIMLAKNLFGEK